MGLYGEFFSVVRENHVIVSQILKESFPVFSMAQHHVGDSAYGVNGKLNFYPSGNWPDETGSKSNATSDALIPIIKKTGAKGLLSGHNEDIPSGLQEML